MSARLRPARSKWKRPGVAVVLVLLAIQLVRPERPTGELPGDGSMSDHVSVPQRVDAILREACYDCHSDETRWPWYAHVAPLSWYLVRDVRHGRSNLDFSRWSTDVVLEPTPDQRLRWMCRDVREDIMPPRLYALAHPDARLDDEEIERICEWTASARAALGQSPSG